MFETNEKKPLRIFTHVSENDLRANDAEETYHNWVMANERTAAALEAKGYDPVWIDGVYGSKTRAAVVAYQKDNDLASGQLTMQTLDHLGVKL